MVTRTIAPKPKPRHYEDAEQQHVFAWAQTRLLPASPGIEPGSRVSDYLFAVPNGGRRNPREAARFVGLGVKAGVSDMMLALPRKGAAGLWIELKKRRHHFRTPKEADRAVSAEQHRWLDRMVIAGYTAKVAYGADEAIDLITAYVQRGPP
jgi:hypothetical protein